MMESKIRIDEPREMLKEFKGWRGTCHHCANGTVMLPRDLALLKAEPKTLGLRLEGGFCILCGQRYEIEKAADESLCEFDARQWMEKEAQW